MNVNEKMVPATGTPDTCWSSVNATFGDEPCILHNDPYSVLLAMIPKARPVVRVARTRKEAGYGNAPYLVARVRRSW
jgi:hypothetical protein